MDFILENFPFNNIFNFYPFMDFKNIYYRIILIVNNTLILAIDHKSQ